MDIEIRTERDYQNDLVKMFREELGYDYLGKLEYGQGASVNGKGETNSPILDNEVRRFLMEQGRTTMQVEDVLSKLKREATLGSKGTGELIKRSNDFYDTIMMGIKSQPKANASHQDVMLFDFEHIDRNHFAIAEEVSYTDPLTGKNKRPDIVVYVNGIALSIIELKKSTVNVEEAIKQHLCNVKDFIPSFYTTTQFTVASNDGGEFRYGTVNTPELFWCKWKRDTTKVGDKLSERDSYKLFFDKKNFLFFVRYGVLNDGGTKKVLRPHQIYAIKAAAKRMPKKQSGVIWHSQGSGKSLTMVALASYIRQNFSNPRIVVITDRKELDLQIASTFTKNQNSVHHASTCSDLLETINQGTEWLICSLIHKFGSRSGNHNGADNEVDNDEECEKEERSQAGVKVSLDEYLNELRNIIKQKYGNSFKVKGDNIFVFVDECHRTQSGMLHQAMKEIMGKEVMLIGFTGTPLLKKDKGEDDYDKYKNTSVVTFGPYIHRYLHKQAVEDKVILDLRYEFRNVEQVLPDSDKKKLEQDYTLITGTNNLTEFQKNQLEDRWAKMQRIYSNGNRIEKIVNSIERDYKFELLNRDWANAILIAGSINQAYRYYEYFTTRTELGKGRVAVVTSYNPTDNDLKNKSTNNNRLTEEEYKCRMARQSFEDANANINNADDYENWAKNEFLHRPGHMKLLIVVNKLLTGFDAPSATILYIDNEIKDRTLFQAVCRVNRLGVDIVDKETNERVVSHKEFGLIVDFKGLFNNIENAVTKFNDGEGFGGMDPVDIEGLLSAAVVKCSERLINAREAYDSLKKEWENLAPLAKKEEWADKIADYYVSEFESEPPAEERRNVMYKITSGMVTAYNNMREYFAQSKFKKKDIDGFLMRCKEAGLIHNLVKQRSGDDFNPNKFDPDMRKLLDTYIGAKTAETVINTPADFSFLDAINDATDADEEAERMILTNNGNANSAAELIEGKARQVNTDWNYGDAAEMKSFSDKLAALLEELKKRNASAKERIVAIIEHIKSIKKGSSTPDELQNKRSKALWNNRDKWHAPEEPEQAVALIKKIDDFIYKNAGADWQDPDSPDGEYLIGDLNKLMAEASDCDVYEIYRIAARNS